VTPDRREAAIEAAARAWFAASPEADLDDGWTLADGYRYAPGRMRRFEAVADAVLAVADQRAANGSRGIPPGPPSDARGSLLPARGGGEAVGEGRESASRSEAHREADA
jgi:hypothetical protein